MAMQIRDAVLSDFEEIKEIYNQIVLTSTATYNDWPATLEERVAWWQSRRAQGFPVLVAASETAGNDSQLTGERSIPGFASFGEFRAWPGYRFPVEGTSMFILRCAARELERPCYRSWRPGRAAWASTFQSRVWMLETTRRSAFWRA